MPNITYPNQRVIHINREAAKSDFLGIKNVNWQAASRDLGAHALMLYMYLAANADNYELALSPAAITRDIGMPRSTYHDQFKKLVDRGYLKLSHGNTYEFFETPQPRDDTQEKSVSSLSIDGYNFEDCTADDIPNPIDVKSISAEDIEINNIYSINNDGINNSDDFQKKEELYPEKIIHITSPKAKRKKDIKLPPKKEFIF